MLDIITIGTSFSPLAYQNEETGKLMSVPPTPELALHHFAADDQGCLEHRIDGTLRAVVPPEGLEGYMRCWPDCAPIARTLIKADHSNVIVDAPVDPTA